MLDLLMTDFVKFFIFWKSSLEILSELSVKKNMSLGMSLQAVDEKQIGVSVVFSFYSYFPT